MAEAGNDLQHRVTPKLPVLINENLRVGSAGHDSVFVAVDVKDLDAGLRQRFEVIDRIEFGNAPAQVAGRKSERQGRLGVCENLV